jgi:hypothetical protein
MFQYNLRFYSNIGKENEENHKTTGLIALCNGYGSLEAKCQIATDTTRNVSGFFIKTKNTPRSLGEITV